MKAEVFIRRFKEGDSISELTSLLNRAYKELGDIGLDFLAVHQNDEITRIRLKDSECFIGLINGRIVGTITLYSPKPANKKPPYGRLGLAKWCQFAVDPDFRKLGIGKLLLKNVESRANEMGAVEVGLDTACEAKHLIDIYFRAGYHIVDYVSWPNTNYYSVVMTKPLGVISNKTDCLANKLIDTICLRIRFVKCKLFIRKDGKRRYWIRFYKKLNSILFRRVNQY